MRSPIEDSANLPDPDIIAAEIDSQISFAHPSGFPSMSSAPANSIVEDLQAALAQFAEITADLNR